MRSLVSWAVQNSPALNTLMVGVMVVGAICLWTMRREEMPEVELEMILVTVPYPGASPEEIEDSICQRMEEAVRSIAGIKKQTSVAQEGVGNLVLELETSAENEKVLNEVRSEIDRIPSFPPELAEDPEIREITFRLPAIRVGVIGPDEKSEEAELHLRDVTEDIRYDILHLPSVSQAEIKGSRDYQIDIEISEDTLRSYGLTLQQVAQIVRRENVEIPGGRMKSASQEVLLRGKNKRLVGEEIERIPLVTQPNGVVLTVGDLGVVRDAFADDTAISLINGKPGLVISVERTSNEDLFAIAEEVKDYVASAELPAGYSLEILDDHSIDVKDRMHLLTRNGLQGLALVFLVLAIFLDLRLSFWVALGIPISVLGAGIVLFYAGQSMNMLSMFAFLMALGIVVDDAIVIGENIYEHRRRGKDLEQAAIEGTIEVLPSVVASVCTTVIAFIPLLFVSGIMGKFFAVLPLAVIAMLVISLIESTFILPCHLAHSHEYDANRPSITYRERWQKYQRWPALLRWTFAPALFSLGWFTTQMTYPLKRLGVLFHWLSQHATAGLRRFSDRVYVPCLSWSLRNPATLICSAISLLLVSLGLVRAGVTPFEVFPKLDSNNIHAHVTYPDGTPARVTDEATRRILRDLDRVNERYKAQGTPLVQTTRRTVGEFSSRGGPGPEARSTGSHVGTVEAVLVDTSQRSVDSEEFLSQWREEVGELVGVESLVFGTEQRGPGGSAIEFKLLSDKEHFAALEEAIEACKQRLADYPGVVDIRDDSRPGKWEFQLQVKDNALAMGVPLADLAETVRASYYGAEVMRLQRGRHEVKLMVRYPPEERQRLSDFDDIRVRTSGGDELPLTELVHVNVQRGYSEINRVDQLRSITVTADVVRPEGNAHRVVQDMRLNFLPGLFAEYPDIRVRWEGQREQANESVASLLIGFVGAILAMFVLLTVEFRSYIQPLIILAVIPFGAVGAIWGHAVMGLSLTMLTLFGMVALTGVVVNDSIVLIDFINLRLRDGLPLREALIDAGRRRFRPVLLTSVTTIAGLLPMLTETSFQAQYLIPMAATMVFGLLVATVMVLLLVPTFYSVYWRAVHGEPARAPFTASHVPLDFPVEVADVSESVLTHRR